MLKEKNKKTILILMMSSIIFGIFAFIVDMNNYVGSAFLILEAFIVYFVLAKRNDNFMSFSALFSGIWLGTIGLANLRLLEYQKDWGSETWVYLILSFFVFNLMILIGNRIGVKQTDNVKKSLNYNGKSFLFSVQKQRLFWICVIITIISFVCLIITWQIVGFIPFFVTNDQMAYAKFYTKFHLITQASTIISGLCYYAIKKGELSKIKKTILYICIFYLVFFMPIITVARGIFICSALSLAIAIFYLNGRKFSVMLVCLMLTFGGYELGSYGRHYTPTALSNFFSPKKINLDNIIEEGEDDVMESESYVLSPRLAFLYSYFTVSHDNFNLAVQKSEHLTYGVRQLSPFKPVLKRVFGNYDKNFEYYKIKPALTTTNFLGTSFYDLRYIGVLLFLTIWGILFGAIESLYRNIKHPILLLIHGNNMTPVFMCFFSAFVNQVSYWMYLAVIVLLFFLLCFKRKEVNN